MPRKPNRSLGLFDTVALTFVSLVFGGFGIGTIVFGGWPTLRDAKASSEWPSTVGLIIHSEVESHSDSDGTSYTPDVRYTYNVGGVEYENDDVAFGIVGSNRSHRARKIVQRYPVDKEVTVYFNAADPSRAVLEPGTTWQSYFLLGFGSLFTLLGLTAGLFPLRRAARWLAAKRR